jgi:hypothetical protein
LENCNVADLINKTIVVTLTVLATLAVVGGLLFVVYTMAGPGGIVAVGILAVFASLFVVSRKMPAP